MVGGRITVGRDALRVRGQFGTVTAVRVVVVGVISTAVEVQTPCLIGEGFQKK